MESISVRDPLGYPSAKRDRPRIGRRALEWLLAGLVAGSAVGVAHGNPTGATVVHGSAGLSNPVAGTLNVTTSSNAIINWQGFSIGSDELTRFIQPEAGSAVLNRVVGSGSSEILGQLLSNGRVFLVNPHGIVFGGNASVDTAGLVASTLAISDSDFLEGNYRFDAGPDAGAIVNRGSMRAGSGGVFLLAPRVENSGVILTEGGDLVLAAGRTITLTSLDLDGVRVEVQAPEDEALNLGTLLAERGAAGAFAGSIRNSGTVEANAVTVDEDGTVRLVAQEGITLEAGGRVAAAGLQGGVVHVESESGTTWISGDVSARGSAGPGGEIRLLGHQVGLRGAQVHASGATGGGEVLVGGDVSGEGEVPTAQSTYVSADSTVSADALVSGDGGKVVVFAEGFASVRGHLSARGGADGGDGGFVETSGLESFEILNTPDTTAPVGEGGEWLINSNNIEIVPGGGNVNLPDGNPFVSSGDGARLDARLLAAALSGGQSVTVRTSEAGENAEGGHISLNAPVDVESTTGTNTLILDAHGDIVINRPVFDARGGAVLNLVFEAGGDIRVGADVTLYDGRLRTDAVEVNVSNGAHVVADGLSWTINAEEISIGDVDRGTVSVREGGVVEANVERIEVGASGDGRLIIESGADVRGADSVIIGQDAGGTGEVIVTGPGSTLDTRWLAVGDSGTGTLVVGEGAAVRARWIAVGHNETGNGTVIVTGSGSTLITAGSDNNIEVGDEGTGLLEVRDGALVHTLNLGVARQGEGRVTIRGVAADGTRSRVIVSPANGRNSGDAADEGGDARVARNAGSNGVFEILNGALLRVLDSDDTFGPGFQLARNKGSVGTLRIDGEGSSLEVIQNGPGGDYGPYVQLGRRGGGTTTISNGGRLLVRGDEAYLAVADGRVNPAFPDSDPSPVDQQSVVDILSGGEIEVSGANAGLYIGNNAASADGVVTVSGPGSALTVSGTDNVLLVGDEGIGTLVIENGARATATHVYVGDDAGSRGVLEVRGSGSALVTTGTDNLVFVGDQGTGECRVQDGGLIDTLWLEVGYADSGTGRMVISGVAADGTRSRVIASPANGKFSGVYADEAGFARVGRAAGSEGVLEILDGGLLRILDGDGTHGPEFQIARNKGSVGRLVIDGAGSSLEVIQSGPAVDGNPRVSAGPWVALGRRGAGTTVIRNGGNLLVQGENALVQVSLDAVFEPSPDPDAGPIDQRSRVDIMSGGSLEVSGEEATFVIGNGGRAADGVVTVSGSGSRIVTRGDNSSVYVGDEGSGELRVLEGGLVDTLTFQVARSGGAGRAVVSGVAADGSRSRVIVSPANGRFTLDDFTTEGGYVGIANVADSDGVLEIRNGALVRVQGGDGTHGTELRIASRWGSVARIVIDGEGSGLEVIQDGPAVPGHANVWAGPTAVLGRRGTGSVTVRNGGRLLVQGERALVLVSRDAELPNRPDPDSDPVDQRSTVDILGGGRLEVRGDGASIIIGDGGANADGTINVSGAGSALSLLGIDNLIVVGDDEGMGRLDVRDGGTAYFLRLVQGANGHANLPEVGTSAVDEESTTNEILAALPDDAAAGGEDPVSEEESQDEEEEVVESAGDTGEETEEQEALPACPG